MTYVLMKDWKVMCRGESEVVWRPLREVRDPFTWPSRDQAEEHARTQGATVIPSDQIPAPEGA